MQTALGLIETKGLIGAIEAADAMLKAANVKLVSKEKVTGALICVKIVGDTAAVKSAVDAGAAAAQRVGELYSAHVIPRPDMQIDDLIHESDLKIVKREKQVNFEPEKEDAPLLEEKSDLVKKIPDEEIPDETDFDYDDSEDESPAPDIPPRKELEELNVHELRRLARNQENFPIKGRDISKANRQELLEYFKSIR
ncbi:BMC domain-containing protein [Bacteroidota bacterium]